jgi:hypothetical protein
MLLVMLIVAVGAVVVARRLRQGGRRARVKFGLAVAYGGLAVLCCFLPGVGLWGIVMASALFAVVACIPRMDLSWRYRVSWWFFPGCSPCCFQEWITAGSLMA